MHIISRGEKIASPALGLAPLDFQGNQGTMPARPPRGFLNNITSHLFRKLSGKCMKFINKDKSYNFGTKPIYKIY